MITATIVMLINLLLTILICIGLVYLFILAVKALRKYLRSGDVRKEKAATCRSLGEALKGHRTRCGMTQEFVAEHLGVSRQAVSKWENGTSDPSTANLLALAKLYEVSPEELLKEAVQ
ncbi:MAG: helix-turn-helix transcriptional regulator [Oscillospiraceae bacterium]|nr:helix-turn-helix transcriptional regulator [Oscillospiraceae bacterium]